METNNKKPLRKSFSEFYSEDNEKRAIRDACAERCEVTLSTFYRWIENPHLARKPFRDTITAVFNEFGYDVTEPELFPELYKHLQK